MTNTCLLINISNVVPGSGNAVMPLGILAVAGSLVARNVTVDIYDEAVDGDFLNQIGKYFQNFKPKMVGLSVMTHNLQRAIMISEQIKKNSPNSLIIWGGSHVTLFPEQIAKIFQVDAGVLGEGHETVAEIFERITDGRDWKNVDGICFHDGERVRINPEVKSKTYSLKSFPYNLLNIDGYRRNSLNGSQLVRFADVISSVGCPYKCRFCINVAENRTWRAMDMGEFVSQIEALIQKYDIRYFNIGDEFFFGSIQRVREFIRMKKEKNLKFYWFANIRANLFETVVDMEFLKILKEEGCIELDLGAESGSQRVLNLLNKNITVAEIEKANRMCKEAGIKIGLSFIIGIPGETYAEILKTKDFIIRLLDENPNAKIFGPQLYRPYPGSPLIEDAKEYGFKIPTSNEEWIAELSDDTIGNMCKTKEMPWLENPEYVDTLNLFLYLYIGTMNLRGNLGVVSRNIRKIANKWLGFVLRNNIYRFPIEKYAWNFVVNRK